jgi:hypothetical protein
LPFGPARAAECSKHEARVRARKAQASAASVEAAGIEPAQDFNRPGSMRLGLRVG